MKLCDPKPLWEEEEVGCWAIFQGLLEPTQAVSISPVCETRLKDGRWSGCGDMFSSLLPLCPFPLIPCLKQKTGLLPQQDSTLHS